MNDRNVDDDDVLGLFREFDPIDVSGGDRGLQLSSSRLSFGWTRSTAVIARWALPFELRTLRCWVLACRLVGLPACWLVSFDVGISKAVKISPRWVSIDVGIYLQVG